MKKIFLIVMMFVFSLGINGIIFANEFMLEGGIVISEGKNIINTSLEFSPIYVEDLIKLFPDITTVSYTEKEREVGYVNVFGGIGENFIILPNKTYEITSQKGGIINLG